jgi:NADPH:quinone reductase-like Zn-dependent oxidoreductase
MKAIAWTKYGSPDVLQLTEVAKPIPKDDEVLIRIRAATVTAGDSEMRRLQFPIWLALPIWRLAVTRNMPVSRLIPR